MRRFFSLLLAAVILCSVFPAFATDPVPVEKITMNPDSASLPYKKAVMLRTTIEPRNATLKTVTWSSSDESVATVKNGLVTGVGTGTATITATAQDGSGVSASALITVVTPVTKIIPEHPSLTLAPNTVWPLFWTIEPATADNRDITWSSSNSKVATVNENGVIYARSVGNCSVIGVAADGSGTKVAIKVQVKLHDLMITEPGDMDVDFETEKAKVAITIRTGGKTVEKNCERQFHTKNGCVTTPEDMVIRPAKAGSDTISILYLEKNKIVKTESYTVFVAPAAMGETASLTEDGEPAPIRFLNLTWGSNYPLTKTDLDNHGRGLKALSQRNEYLRAMVDGTVLFGNITAFSAALNYTYTQDDRLYEVRNALFKGDLYFDPEIPFETVMQAAKSIYSLGQGQLSEDQCVWERGHVRVVLTKKARFTILELIWDGTPEEGEEEAPAEDAAEDEDSSPEDDGDL